MKAEKISAKILGLCVMFVIITGISFMAVSCAKTSSSKITAVESNSNSSAIKAAEKDIMTEVNIKLFGDDYVTPYYLNIDMEYDGKIATSDMGNKIFLCSINNNKFFDISNYQKGEQFIIPQDIGNQIIKNRFYIESIDYSKISFYNAPKKAYIIDLNSLGQGAYVCTVIKSIKQTGDEVVVTADFVSPDENTGEPDYSKKLETLEFTLKNNNGNYLYEKVKTIWKDKQ